MMLRKLLVAFAIAVAFVVFVTLVVTFSFFSYKTSVVVDGKTFNVEVVDTPALLQKGLSGHSPLSPNQGMLFVFQKQGKYGFWMKDMTFPIDIIWIDANYKIIHIEKSVSPISYPKVFYPDSPALYVLEISSGQSESGSFHVGDSVEFTKK